VHAWTKIVRHLLVTMERDGPSMPSPHACMPLFTTWYALIPGIILCLTGGIRPYAPRQHLQGCAALYTRAEARPPARPPHRAATTYCGVTANARLSICPRIEKQFCPLPRTFLQQGQKHLILEPAEPMHARLPLLPRLLRATALSPGGQTRFHLAERLMEPVYGGGEGRVVVVAVSGTL
jgi:hypothetical protein